ncbi:MAG: 8-amino-7-oxononanoate synthase [Deltaproteobacteria bacterium]|nr:8-amino-7-oxononanoate synthase [Deltaproteobacteria bacterium]
MDKFNFVDAELSSRTAKNRLRDLFPVVPLTDVEIDFHGQRVINFCSNDYLGLSMHPALRERAGQYLDKYGSGATASRLVCGDYDIFSFVEAKIARAKHKEAALVFNSGFQANISILPALANHESVIFSDALNHNSIIQGARLSRARVVVFPHNDIHGLKRLLSEHALNGVRIIIVTESIFSMDGDIADLETIRELSYEFNSILVVDDAHATGVMGKNGMGLASGDGADVIMSTFSKGGGGFGACVACSKRLRDYFINVSPGFIYSTALPPAVIGAIDAALDIIPQMDKEREKLCANAGKVRRELHNMGWDTGNSGSQIIPVVVGPEQKALALSSWLFENGILAVAIRPPSVPEGGSRIRISLCAGHSDTHIDRLLDTFDRFKGV